jgi:hypothetical protein
MLVDGLNALPNTNITTGLIGSKSIVFSGNLSVSNNFSRWYPNAHIAITDIVVSVGAAAIGNDIQISIKKNGIALIDSPIVLPAGDVEITVPVGSLTSSSLTNTDNISVDVLQVGTTFQGRDLVVQINYSVV